MDTSSFPPIGKLEVTIVSASDLLAKDLNGKSDPYVFFDLAGQHIQTTVIDMNLNPVWNETFLFDMVLSDIPQDLLFTVMDHDNIGSHDFIGQYNIHLTPILTPSTVIDGSFELEDKPKDKRKVSKKSSKKKDKKRGNLKIRIAFHSPIPLLTTLFQQSFSFMRFLCSTIIEEDLAFAIIIISQSLGIILPLLETIISDEIHKEIQVTSLFRTDSMSTKMMRRFAILTGHNWLNLMIIDLVKRIVDTPGTFEVDPNKIPQGQNVEQNLEIIRNNTNQFIENILSKHNNCPNEIRIISRYLFDEVEKKFEKSGNQALAGFIFLRFICPAIISPTTSNIIHGNEISTDSQRHLILIAKIIQCIANGIEFGQKEPFMIPFNNYVELNVGKVQSYLFDLAHGTSTQSIDIPKVTPHEVLTEIDILTEIIHKNYGIIEPKVPQNLLNEWQAVKQEVDRYLSLGQSRIEKTKVRNIFCIFH